MKKMTKEWVKDYKLLELVYTFKPISKNKIPFVFTNGGAECIAKKDLYTVKTNFAISEKENEFNFIMLPDTFDLNLFGYDEKFCANNFLSQYINRLRLISYLPEDILKNVKDKRLLALGYADGQVKKQIIKYAKSKFNRALKIYDKSCEKTVEAEQGLTIHKQFIKHDFPSLPLLFDDIDIKKTEKVNDNLILKLSDNTTIVFIGAKIIEAETDILNAYVEKIELYKNADTYELHLLLMKRDKNLTENYYYATIAFKDLKFKK